MFNLKLVTAKNKNQKTVIKLKDVLIGEKFTFIAGPCSVENVEQMQVVAEALKDIGVDILRGGVFKTRRSPYDFQGLEFEGLKILSEISNEYKLPIITEIIDVRDVEKVAQHVDIIQVGARNMYNTPLLKELGKLGKPILLKRAMNATVNEWLNAAEYILLEGNTKVILCERGIRTFETYTRNTLDIAAVPVLKYLTHLPVFVDPSHSSGKKELVEPLSLAAVASGADGLIVEVHPKPLQALCDKEQALDLVEAKSLYSKVQSLKQFMKTL